MKRILSLLSTVVLSVGCSNSGSGSFATNADTITPVASQTLMTNLEEGLLYKSECIVQGNRSLLIYISKNSGKFLYEIDYLDNMSCSFDNNAWLQAIRITYLFSSDLNNIVSGIKQSNEYIILNDDYIQTANQSNFCDYSNWQNGVWIERSNSSCDLTDLNTPISFGYEILEDSINFNGIIFNK